MTEVIITHFSNPTKQGVVLHTNIPAKLKGGKMATSEKWVSWDKIGKALFENYAESESVSERDNIRNL